MITEGTVSGTYLVCSDTTLSDLKLFQNIFYNKILNYEKYDKMRPVGNQPEKLFGTAKTSKFNIITDINVEELNFSPIIERAGTFTYTCSKVIAEYLKPVCQTEYSIKNTQCFLEMLRDLPPR